MAETQALLAQIRQELESVEARLREHPYLRALEQSEIATDRLGVIVGEQQLPRPGDPPVLP